MEDWEAEKCALEEGALMESRAARGVGFGRGSADLALGGRGPGGPARVGRMGGLEFVGCGWAWAGVCRAVGGICTLGCTSKSATA